MRNIQTYKVEECFLESNLSGFSFKYQHQS
ncbi:hypothetical protein SAMN05443246_2987 [Paenibacillus sp. GP183]|nr:hypothetical protein SAMN05443246_2987 [Paenibacillus sp. GP183]